MNNKNSYAFHKSTTCILSKLLHLTNYGKTVALWIYLTLGRLPAAEAFKSLLEFNSGIKRVYLQLIKCISLEEYLYFLIKNIKYVFVTLNWKCISFYSYYYMTSFIIFYLPYTYIIIIYPFPLGLMILG